MLRRSLIVSFVALTALLGCKEASGPLSPANADAVGILASTSAISQHGEFRLLLDNLSVRPEPNGARRIYLLATTDTPVYVRESGQPLHRASLSDLEVGARIFARVGGAVLDSDPAQYGAVRIDAEQ